MAEAGFTGMVIGYGSIGRRHAQVLAGLTSSLVIVNRRESVRAQALREHPTARVIAQIEALDDNSFPWKSTLVVIATWAASHAELFHALADRGVRYVLCEKPIAASAAQAHAMVERARQEGVSLAVNHCLRYQGIAPALCHFFEENGLGEPVAVFVEGGAACLVTNGIHWLDFAIELFGSAPESVISSACGKAINPRSPELLYYGGSATWRFGRWREATISFSNRSSVEPIGHIYLRDAVAHVTHDLLDGRIFLNTTIQRRDSEAVERWPSVTRLGPADHIMFSGKLPGVRFFMEALDDAIEDVLHRGGRTAPGVIGVTAVSGAVGALLSSREGTAVALPLEPDSPWGQEVWPIS